MSDTKILALLERLAAGQAELQAAQTELLARVDRVEKGQAGLRGEITTLRVDLMGRMDRLENKLTAIRDDISVNFGAVDQNKRAHDNTREELRGLGDTVSALWRQIKRLESEVREIRGEP